ncbi:hypothetical protein HUJ04_013059 [Dendroctonus ponderosae]|uniref:Uncharacterized protein n=1 Tax=Dendroctonus ponderosae TaxID=77166 RepID=A0AAR5P244_DENPD|nr:hypothetical protein HUJ04_013059 [Dendroctonus ponderosae]
MEELEAKIDSLNSSVSNATFVDSVKAAIEAVNQVEVSIAEERIIAKVFPLIQARFDQIFADNATFCVTVDDDLMCALTRENLEVIFQLAEIVQEFMNYIHDHSPMQLSCIESVLKYLPLFIQMSADHWKNSADEYKTVFNEELAKLFEVLKHLYASYLYLLERSIQVGENGEEINLLVDALTVLCEMPKVFSVIDASSILSSWKCFTTVTSNYSQLIENDLDIRVPIQLLTDDICEMLKSLNPRDAQTFPRQLKILTYLVKVLCKITYNFKPQLSKFASEMLEFFVKFLCYLSDVHANKAFLKETTQRIDAEVVKLLEGLLGTLLVTESGAFKELLKGFSKITKLGESSCGYVALLAKILQIISNMSSDWSDVLPQIIEDIFEFLPNCCSYLCMDGPNGEMYQHLIVQAGLAVLLQDSTFECSQVLLKHILQGNGFAAILALEVYCLIASNISPEECLSLLINLLYAIQEMQCGFFTNRPEISYLKCLVQRLYSILPDTLKEEVVKLFRPEQHIQVWRFLEFANFPNKSRKLLEPIVEITADSIHSFTDQITENMIVNVGESIDLLSTIEDLALINSSKASIIVGFLSKFWSCRIDNGICSNNILKYMFWKISRITASCIIEGRLKPSLVFPKFQVMLKNQSYSIPVLFIINCLIHSECLADPELLRETTGLITLALRSHNTVRESELEMLATFNYSHKKVLNVLLDSLNPGVAQEIFGRIEAFKTQPKHQISGQMFVHKCLEWGVDCDDYPPAKKIRVEGKSCHNPVPSIKKQLNHATRGLTYENPIRSQSNDLKYAEDDSSATEAIQRIKGEVKCLLKIGRTEKLTAKNYADLRMLMSQLSSLM